MKITQYAVWAIAHLGAWSLMLVTAAGAGNLFLRKHRFHSSIERLAFTLTLGLGLCALALFALGLVGLLYPALIQALTALSAAATIFHTFRSRRKSWRDFAAQWKNRLELRWWKQYIWPRRAILVFVAVFALGYWAMLLLATQYPPLQWDAISNHLFLAREYLTLHRPVAVLGASQPVLPALNHMLFAWALALYDDILAQMVEHTFLMLTALGLYAWGNRQDRPALGFAAAAFWLAHPLVLWLGSAAYVDIAASCFVFLGIYALRLFRDQKEASWWYLGLALLAMAAGAKLPGLFFLGLGAMLGFAIVIKDRIARMIPGRRFVKDRSGVIEDAMTKDARLGFTFKPLVLGWMIAFIVAVPWYAFITYYTGNPIWPTFPQHSRGVWGAPWIVDNVTSWMQNAGEPRTLRNFLMLSIDWIRYPDRFFAELHLSLFPLIIIWPLAWVISLFNASVRWWTIWALAFTFFWFLYAHQLRYWLMALPLASLALYESLEWIFEKVTKSATARAALWVTIATLTVLLSGRGVLADIKWKGAPPVSADERESFLAILGGYNGVKYVNGRADKNDTVCVLSASWLNYYFKPRVIDLRGALHLNRHPTFRWPADELWIQWLDYQNVNWIFVYYKDESLPIPKQNPVLNPFWPDYQIVYADSLVWVFRRKPVPPDVSFRRKESEPEVSRAISEVDFRRYEKSFAAFDPAWKDFVIR